MSRADESSRKPPPSPEGSPYNVGFGKPPKEHRFKKGQSGNPRGRPPKATREIGDDWLSAAGRPANRHVLEEAYRLVTLREGDKVTTLPVIQAVIRAMGVKALRGDRYAQRVFTDIVRTVEDRAREEHVEHFTALVEHKTHWERAIEFAREQGLKKEPQPIPHPDDIIIDLRAGTATINGPATKEDKEEWDRHIFECRDQLQETISDFARRHKRARSAEKRTEFLNLWIGVQRSYDEINDNLPKRYRKQLEDRCWDEGASRPGSMKEHHWPGEL